MSANEHPTHSTSPGESNTSTRQPTQLAVLLAGAGTPPLEPEQARLAAIRLWDAFVLSPERARLFFGDPRALFPDRSDLTDLRHDALARVVRQIAATLRMRLEQYDNTHPGSELIRNLPALTHPHIEGSLTAFDLQLGTGRIFTAESMLGSTAADVDPLDAPDSGVLRRFVALTTRGLMVDKAGARAAGVVNDLGAVTLALSLIDVCANPRSALRAARSRLSKAQKLRTDEIMRVRDVSEALRQVLAHVVSSATTSGALGRDLVKDSVIAPERLDHLVVALARAVYDGLTPHDEHPLMVPGTDEADVFTAVPTLAVGEDEESRSDLTLGRYNRIAFVAMPYAQLGDTPAPRPRIESRRPPRAAVLDEAAFSRARDTTRVGSSAARVLPGDRTALSAIIDAAGQRFTWQRTAIADLPARIRRTVELTPPAAHVVLVVGPRSTATHELVDTLGAALGEGLQWNVLAPRATDHTLALEPLENAASAGLHLRRGDVSRWLEPVVLRNIHWDNKPGVNVIVNAAAAGNPSPLEVEVLCDMVRDLTDRADPRSIVLLIGAETLRSAAGVLASLGLHPDLESGEVPLRMSNVWLIRTDAPLVTTPVTPDKSVDEAILMPIAEAFSPSPTLAELAVRATMLPPEAKFRGRLIRLSALSNPPAVFAAVRPTLERAAGDPWLGTHLRRTIQQGIGCTPTTRVALASGLTHELLGCLRHEILLLVTEWEGVRERPHAARLADVARGVLLELVFAAHPRVAVLANDAIAEALTHLPGDLIERASIAEQLHSAALALRPTGTVYATDDVRGPNSPLGFVFRGGAADLYAFVDVMVGPPPTRATPAPSLELTWKPSPAPVHLSLVATAIDAVHDLARRWNRESTARLAARENRSTFAMAVDVSIDNKLTAESVRIVLPLAPGAADVDTQRLAVDIAARLLEVTGSAPTDWSAHATLDSKGPSVVALVGPMLLREFVSRWTRALRLLSRHFPLDNKTDGRYATAPLVRLGADMGIATALLQERNIGPSSANGRAVLTRLTSSAAEVVPRVRDLAAILPVRSTALEGPDLEIVERVVAIAWFLHTNFCQSSPGSLEWAPSDAPQMRTLVEQYLDRSAIKQWLQRKVSRPDTVETRFHEFIESLEPTIVIEKQ